MFTFDDFEQSGTFLVQKSWFFSSSFELPRICDRSRSEHENSCFSQSTSYISIFSEHFAIFVGSPSRIFWKITVLNTVLNSFRKRLSKKHVHFWWWWAARNIFGSKTSKGTAFLLNRPAMLLKTVSKTVIFRKILDGDLRKITKCSLKIEEHEVLCEKHWFSGSERLRSH